MQRIVVGGLGAMLLLGALVSGVTADEGAQPSQGEHSAGRNVQGTGFGPHCHVVVAASGQGPFDSISVMPSHRGHVATNTALGSSAVFVADPDCDGVVPSS